MGINTTTEDGRSKSVKCRSTLLKKKIKNKSLPRYRTMCSTLSPMLRCHLRLVSYNKCTHTSR